MGGGDSYYGGDTGLGSSSRGPSCAALAFDAPVASPNPDVVATLNAGAACVIALEGKPAQLLVRVVRSGEILGGITEGWQDLVRCIGAGYEYQARVIALRPVVRVRISPAPAG